MSLKTKMKSIYKISARRLLNGQSKMLKEVTLLTNIWMLYWKALRAKEILLMTMRKIRIQKGGQKTSLRRKPRL